MKNNTKIVAMAATVGIFGAGLGGYAVKGCNRDIILLAFQISLHNLL
jgi:hypothetical protein